MGAQKGKEKAGLVLGGRKCGGWFLKEVINVDKRKGGRDATEVGINTKNGQQQQKPI